MAVRVEVEPALLEWAAERSRLERGVLVSRFPKLPEWEQRETLPTLKQLENYAHATHTPLGFLLLDAPPVDVVPIEDFRTMGDRRVSAPSVNLLDSVYACQQRQDWYRDFARTNGEDPLPFVGSLGLNVGINEAAGAIAEALSFTLADRRQIGSWTAALDHLRDRAEALGVLVMISGVVGSDGHRKLDPTEFRGFALADDLAPVVFVNGSDTKAAQIFTLVHELAHIWLGRTGVSDADLGSQVSDPVERWCNQVAAEVLVPSTEIRDETFEPNNPVPHLDRIAKRFKVSTLVVLRRLFEVGKIDWVTYRRIYGVELARVVGLAAAGRKSSGGDFYNTNPVRVSKRFARALIASTWEGHTLYRDATRLLGFKKLSTLDTLGEKLGVA